MKVSKYFVGIIAFTLINFMYFIWQPYFKGIICFPFADNSVSTIIASILYFIIYSIIVILTYNYGLCDEKEQRISKKSTVFTSLVFLGMRLVLDGITGLAALYFTSCSYIANDVCSATFFVASFCFVLKHNKLQPHKENKKFLPTLFFTLAVVTLVIFSIFNIFDVIDINNWELKYYTDSDIFLSKLRYSNFISEIRSIFAETIFQTFFLGGLYSYFTKPSVEEMHEFKSRTVAKAVSRVMLMVLGCFAITVLKAAIFTEGTIGNIHTTNSVTSYIAQDKLDVNYKNLYIYRRKYGNQQYEVFNKSTADFMLNNAVLHSETVAGISNKEAPRELTAVTQYNANGIEFHVYANDIIAIRDDNNSFSFYKLKDFKNQEYNEKLIACCEYMITEGAFSFFEYGYEYLLKHDPDFIKPYILYYSEGFFSEVKLENPHNAGIKPTYMKGIAQKINMD